MSECREVKCLGCLDFFPECVWADLDDFRDAMRWPMAEYPTLCADGLVNDPAGKWELQRRRAEMLSDASVKQFMHAFVWLFRQPKARRFCEKGTSYTLKHVMERATGHYCTNGVFIAAALANGFKIRQADPASPNVFLNVTASAFKEPTP